jgi:antitoxin YefM
MLTGIRQKAMVNKARMIEISAADLPRGTWVEVIVLVDLDEPDEPIDEITYTDDPDHDETAYLLSNPANRQRLQNALRQLENRNAG